MTATKKPKATAKPTETPTPAEAPPPQRLPDSAPHTVSHMLGEITWLMTQSPRHKHYALVDLEWMLMPAIMLQQFRLFHDKGRPVGAALWAFLSAEAEAKLALSPPRLRPDEWKSGDRCWLIDLIAPLATAENKLADAMLADLQNTALKGQTFQFHRTDAATGKREVVFVRSNQENN